MDTTVMSPSQLTDEDLLAKVKALAAEERQATAALVAHLAELDARRLSWRRATPLSLSTAPKNSTCLSTPRTTASRRRARREGSPCC